MNFETQTKLYDEAIKSKEGKKKGFWWPDEPDFESKQEVGGFLEILSLHENFVLSLVNSRGASSVRSSGKASFQKLEGYDEAELSGFFS